MLGLPIYLVLRLLDRGGTPHGLLAAVAGGLGANLMPQLHWPISAPLDLMLGHLTVVLAFVVFHALRIGDRRRVD